VRRGAAVSAAPRPIAVRWFAALVDRTGCASETLRVEDGADVERLWRTLVERHPTLADLPFRPLVACDLEYSDWRRDLAGVREVAFLPPVSGG
jgi:molybdopterin converting factor small subunit